MARLNACGGLALLLAGCSYKFGGDLPDVPLLGDPPLMSSFQRLNDKPAQDALFVRGADKSYWLALREYQQPGALLTNQMVTVKRLSLPEKIEQLQAHHVHIVWWAFYLVQPNSDPTMPTKLTVHPAGSKGPDDEYLFPPGDEILRQGAGGAVFTYWVKAMDTTGFDVIRRKPLYRRHLPSPAGLDPMDPLAKGAFFFSYAGDLLFTRDAEGLVVAHSTAMEADTQLGVRPRGPIIDDARQALIFCGDDGLRSVPYDGSLETVLDPDSCNPQGTQFDGTTLLYLSGTQTRQVPADGSAKPRVVMTDPAQRLLYQTDDGQVLYSLDPGDRYIYGAGDGWLKDWRFMERGLLGYSPFSNDGKRLRFIEHAADNLGVGDLLSATVPNGDPLRLARNVPWYQFEELPDGRVLAVSNYTFPGPHNRIIVIDEATRQAHWVADSASAYQHIPGSYDLMIEMPVDAGGLNLVRVPLPAKAK